MKLKHETYKKILVTSGYVSEEEFDDAAQSARDLGKKLDDVLIFRGLISEDALGKLIAEHFDVPFIDVGKQTITDEILSIIPEKLARNYRMVPFAKEDDVLMLAMSDPTDFEALEFAKRQTGLDVTPYYSTEASIRNALGQYKRNIRQDFDKVIAENVKKASPGEDPVKAAEDLPIVKVLDTILGYAVAEGASDVHIEIYPEQVLIRFRIDGILQDIIKLPRGIEEALVARIKILSNLKIDEHRVPQDGRYKFQIDDDVVALRISIVPGFYGENVVMRLLPESNRPLSLEELGLSGKNLEIVKKNIEKPHGMILVTGPTGSGKTTTLYSTLNILNTIKVKICTIEDPVEYGIKRVNQIQVNPKAGLEFSTGLRSLLRHDPDIIMVGEIRDSETADIAVHAALTGHLVLSTLHTNDAAGTIPRMLDMGVEGYLVASTVNAIIAQRLVRRICSTCIKEYTPDKAVVAKLEKDVGLDPKTQKFYRGEGCDECHGSGFQGRIGIYEVLSLNEAVRDLVTSKANSEQIMDAAVKGGMTTMVQDGLNKVSSGLTTIEEVLRAVQEK